MIAALFTQAGARLACLVKGHRRGVRIATISDGGVWDKKYTGISCAQFECPRCKATWARKAKAT
jgi:hypothetical protein